MLIAWIACAPIVFASCHHLGWERSAQLRGRGGLVSPLMNRAAAMFEGRVVIPGTPSPSARRGSREGGSSSRRGDAPLAGAETLIKLLQLIGRRVYLEGM